MDKINYTFFIEKYLDGEMNDAEKKWFEKELENNPQLQEELELREEVNIAVNEADIMELRDELKSIHSNLYPENTPAQKKVAMRRLLIPIAASIIVAVVTFAIHPFNKNYTNQELLAKYYTPYDAGMSYRSATTTEESLLKNAYESYREKRFEDAIKYFEAALKKDLDMASYFYSGMSYLELKKYSPAETNFEVVINNNDNLYIEQAEWYLGLCYIASGQTDRAKQLFTKISKSDSYYAAKAKKLTKHIK